MKIKLASPITFDSIVDGPGLRMVVWTQGCTHKCVGCHNPQTHNINSGYEVDIDEIKEKMQNVRLNRGVTISGGEPFLQPEECSHIAKEAHENNLDVWVYSGFTIDELLETSNPMYFKNVEFLKNIDILVDGKFDINQKDINIKFRGSQNQRIIDVRKTLEQGYVCIADEFMERQLLAIK